MTAEIINGDCLEVMRGMDAECIDLTVTSPPYDNLREYKGYTFDFEGIACELFRVTKKGGVVVWVVGDATINGSETGTSFRQALYFKEIGFNLHDTMIYQTAKAPLTHKRYEQHFEYMFVLCKGSINTFNPITEKKIWEDNRKVKSIRREKDGSFDLGFVSPKEDKIKGNVWIYSTGGGHATTDNFAHLQTYAAFFTNLIPRPYPCLTSTDSIKPSRVSSSKTLLSMSPDDTSGGRYNVLIRANNKSRLPRPD